MKNSIELGKILKERRLSFNFSMEFVAKKIGITRSTLWAIESGKGNYSIKTFLSLIDILSLELNLIGKTDDFSQRKRASKAYTSKKKEINRFIVNCVQHYALFSNQSGKNTYIKMKDKGLIDLLKNEYEDLHGESFDYLCDFIEIFSNNN